MDHEKPLCKGKRLGEEEFTGVHEKGAKPTKLNITRGKKHKFTLNILD